MNHSSKKYWILFILTLLGSGISGFLTFNASKQVFLGGLGFLIIFYFLVILTIIFLGLAIVNYFSGRDSSPDISTSIGILGLVIFGISRIPLRWYEVSGVGVPSTLAFLGVLFMIFSVVGIIKKKNKKNA